MNKAEANTIKGIAIILMYVHHLFYLVDRVNKYNISPLFFSQNCMLKIGAYGKVCVAIFSFISGYGLTKVFYGNSNCDARCIIKRVLRLQLSTMLCLISGVAVASALGKHTYSEVYMGSGIVRSVLYFICDAAGLAFLYGTPLYNGAWWYLTIAIWIIVIIPIVCSIIEKIGNKFIICFIFLYLAVKLHCVYDGFWLNLYIYGIFFPIVGVVLATHDEVMVFAKRKKRLFFIISVICIFIGYIGFDYISPNVEFILLLSVIGITFIGISLCELNIIAKGLGILGKYSKYMFLCHSFFLSYFFQEHIYSFRYPIIILAILIAETLVVSIFLSVFEVKILYFLKKIINLMRDRVLL
ncbi:acyltransferase family protein [Butyrivibrio sp. LB2008]|uniref:acyltransferase family protein n=1 Tax=Butyrivibrio sp. LB2008 TaxID=1408305 RepID=UPI00047D6132|nr:acyltransferase family protein [Butyrivibrio sp. LB2008]